MPVTIISSEARKPIASFPETGVISRTAPLRPLVLGERLDAVVVGRYSVQQVRLQLGGSTVTADSRIALNPGETLTVRVERLFPGVVLRICDRGAEDLLRIGEFLKAWRANPGALKGLLQEVRALFGAEKSDPFPDALSKRDMQGVVRLLEQIVVSKENVGRPLYLKESLTALGLDFERGLLKAPAGEAGAKGESLPSSLKEVLLRWSAPGAAAAAGGPGSPLKTFVEQALKVIESLQLVNVLAQEQEQLTVLQIPCQCADGIRMQELFIAGDGAERENGEGQDYRAVLFVDLDALGALAVEASRQNGRFHCTIKGQNRDVLAYLEQGLPELEAQLGQLGYRTPLVRCVHQEDLAAWKRDFLMQYRLYSQSTISVRA
jgi:hypothetical protein